MCFSNSRGTWIPAYAGMTAGYDPISLLVVNLWFFRDGRDSAGMERDFFAVGGEGFEVGRLDVVELATDCANKGGGIG